MSPLSGFTLVELLVVLAMISVLAAIAFSYSGESAANVRGFAEEIVGDADSARLRAISSRRWQRMRFDLGARKVVVEQAVLAGMDRPTDDADYAQVSTLDLPRAVDLWGIATTANLIAGEGVPGEDEGLTEHLYFGPDGAGEPRTVYLRSATGGRNPWRVVVYRATGTAVAKESW